MLCFGSIIIKVFEFLGGYIIEIRLLVVVLMILNGFKFFFRNILLKLSFLLFKFFFFGVS